MNKIVLIVVFSVFALFFLNAQQPIQQKPAPQKKAVPSAPKPVESTAAEEEVDPADVDNAVRELVDKLKKEKESDPVPVSLTMSYSRDFVRFSKYPRIETDTKISVAWYKNISESLSKLVEIKSNIKTSTFNKEEERLKELRKIYKESVARIIYLLEHPQKLSEKK